MKTAGILLMGILALCAQLQPAIAAARGTAKAGVCPDPAMEAVNCTVGCQSDGDCESTLKCCPAACGKACQNPDGNTPSCSWPRCPEPAPLLLADNTSQPVAPVLRSAVAVTGLGTPCVSSCSAVTGGWMGSWWGLGMLLWGSLPAWCTLHPGLPGPCSSLPSPSDMGVEQTPPNNAGTGAEGRGLHCPCCLLSLVTSSLQPGTWALSCLPTPHLG
ncbi:uncharacterized protein LOC134522599 isoform X1 [Chroicocephalus ridibundus]|uniref:uncharacterized protein LOC134522599 isoform X1 n=1 Tax=Chroicocephalus ridibundus TaxID=1192867 RepID=UPI002FDC873C